MKSKVVIFALVMFSLNSALSPLAYGAGEDRKILKNSSKYLEEFPASHYVALVRRPWKLGLPKYSANNALWLLEKE